MSFRNEEGEIIRFGVRVVDGDTCFAFSTINGDRLGHLIENVNRNYPVDSADIIIDDAAKAIDYKVTWQDRIDIRAHLLSELDKYI